MSYQRPTGQPIDLEAPPAPTRTPVVFEPPYPLVDRTEVWLATSGGGPSWGGVCVGLSEDDDEYPSAGMLSGASTWGALVDDLPAAAPGWDEDGCARVLLRDGGTLGCGDEASARRGATLAYVGTGNDYELLAYAHARLLGREADAHLYELSGGLYRGAYSTPPRAHRAGDSFLLLRGRLLRIPIEPRLIGWPVYLKLVAVNPCGEGAGDPADVEPIVHHVEGVFLRARDPERFALGLG